MLRLWWYLSKMLLLRWVASAFGLVLLIGFVDSLSKTSEIADSDGGTGLDYMVLRAPIIFDQIFLFTLAIAILLTLVSLIRRNELVAFHGFGMSPTTQLRIFAPTVIFISILSGLFIDVRLPASVRALNVWGIADYKGGSISEETPLWLNDQAMNMSVSITGRIGLDRLTGLTFYIRNADGNLRGVAKAGSATYEDGAWALEDTKVTTLESAEDLLLSRWETQQSPDLIDRLAAEPRHLNLGDLAQFESLRGSGSRPSAAYLVWRLKRLTLPLSGLAILILCIPMMQRLGRRDSGTAAMVFTLGVSFVFLIVDGIATTLGAKGALSPIIASIGLSGGLILVGFYLMLRQEILE